MPTSAEIRAAKLKDLARLLVEIRTRHPRAKSAILAVGFGGCQVYPSERDTPLWPNETRELLDEYDEPYSLRYLDHATERDAFAELFPGEGRFWPERPFAVARLRGDDIEVEIFERARFHLLSDDELEALAMSSEPSPIESLHVKLVDMGLARRFAASRAFPKLRHLTMVDSDTDALPILRDAHWWPQIERLTMLDEFTHGSLFRDGVDVPTLARGSHASCQQVGWELAFERSTRAFSVALVGFDDTASLDAIARELRDAWYLNEPIMLMPSRWFQPTTEDALALSKKSGKHVVVVDDHWRHFVRPLDEAEPAVESAPTPPRFATSDCTVFVIYAVPTRHAAVEPGQPTLVLPDADELLLHFGRYESPYPLELSSDQLCERLENIREEWRPLAFHDEMITQILTFVSKHRRSSFICVLEPPAIAGEGTAIDLMGP